MIFSAEPFSNDTDIKESHFAKHLLPIYSTDLGNEIRLISVAMKHPSSIRFNIDPDSNFTRLIGKYRDRKFHPIATTHFGMTIFTGAFSKKELEISLSSVRRILLVVNLSNGKWWFLCAARECGSRS